MWTTEHMGTGRIVRRAIVLAAAGAFVAGLAIVVETLRNPDVSTSDVIWAIVRGLVFASLAAAWEPLARRFDLMQLPKRSAEPTRAHTVVLSLIAVVALVGLGWLIAQPDASALRRTGLLLVAAGGALSVGIVSRRLLGRRAARRSPC
ncbi:hypothetical protein [Cryptosporangium minutisporangium]|uniref:Uncharacterized protein n=1 Tax=Cryptosporangium minutisporangium TaxID=113569 RepID=A0ABP6SQ42_9ACTN